MDYSFKDTIIDTFARNDTSEIRLQVSEYLGDKRLDFRRWWLDTEANEWRPTKFGVRIKAEEVERFVKAVEKASKMFL